MYKTFIRPVLFLFDPERIHYLIINVLRLLFKIPGVKAVVERYFTVSDHHLEKEVFGIRFPNPVGLAAGFDKDAKMLDELAAFGFGFIEIGTLTPKPEQGNPIPRLFRLPKDKALINRMGFNNAGVIDAVNRLKKNKSDMIIGGNISKNKDTPIQYAFRDYEYCFEALFNVVDFFVINVSSPNTPDLRNLQEKEPLKKLLKHMKDRMKQKATSKPLLLKIAPDLTERQLDDIVEIITDVGIDGIIATNTTISREKLITGEDRVKKMGDGGLSGLPLKDTSTQTIKYLRGKLGEKIRIIGVGGIFTPADAIQKLNAGADLVQVFTGFIYEGPSIAKKINKAILSQT